MDKRLLGVRIFGCLYLIEGSVMVYDTIRELPVFFLYFINQFLIGLLTFVTGIGLLKLKEWARIACIIINFYGILYFIEILLNNKLLLDMPLKNIIFGYLAIFCIISVLFVFPIYFFTRFKIKEQFNCVDDIAFRLARTVFFFMILIYLLGVAFRIQTEFTSDFIIALAISAWLFKSEFIPV